MSTILLAEDEQPIAHLIQDLLIDEGHEVYLAAHGRQALEILTEVKPDLIICDLMMPVMDGLELGRRLQENPQYARIPLIIMSAARRLSKEPGFPFEAFIAKPFEIKAFVEIVQAVMERTQHHT